MRPLKLTMKAFGPYAGEQTIDFSELKGRNLFLITGSTGAGKTTIFDGICYAIYGKASGRDRDGESLRSHFAEENLLTSVELEFELKGKSYWIKRVPKQLRKRARGEGFAEQNAEAQLKTFDRVPLLIEGVRQVDEKINQILGITYEQFKQIIMIPQGEFRELLIANSSDRENILQKIFGTEGFRSIQERLIEKERTLRNEVKELADQREGKIQSLDPSTHESLSSLLSGHILHVPEIIKETESAIRKDQEEIRKFDHKLREQEDFLFLKQKDCLAAQENNRKLEERDQAGTQKTELELQKPYYDHQKEILENARKALTIIGIENHYSANVQLYAHHTFELQEAEKDEKQALQELENARKCLEEEKKRNEIRQKLNEELTKLKGLSVKIEEFQADQIELTAVEKALTTIRKEQNSVQTELSQVKQQLLARQRTLENSLKAAKEYVQRSAEREKVARRLAKAKELKAENEILQNLQRKQEISKEKIEYEENHLKITQQRVETARKNYRQGLAGVLAENLETGEPCPVCGSLHHPLPAVKGQDVPGEKELNDLERELKDTRNHYEYTKTAWDKLCADYESQQHCVARIQSELDRMKAEFDSAENLQGSIPAAIPEMQELLNALSREVMQLSLRKDQEVEIRVQLQQDNEKQQVLESRLEKISEEEKSFCSRVNGLREMMRKMEKDLPPTIRTKEELEEEVRRIRKEYDKLVLALETANNNEKETAENYISALTLKESAFKNLTRARQEMEKAYGKFIEDRDKAGFSTLEEYNQAKKNEEEMKGIETKVLKFQGDLRSAMDYFEKMNLEVQDLNKADLMNLEEEIRHIQQEKDFLSGQKTTVVSRENHNRTLLSSILEIGEKIGKKEEDYKVVGDLANAAKGNNSQRISFERYVLAAFFHDIIVAANIRLHKMTYGRYQMSRIIEKGKGMAQSGLEIEVFDYYTGRARHVKTLSGGESFKASLALALGLADVVQSYAGGVSLDTMFVDEGFGTLDPESLDSAVNTLMELQHSGRLVGIISHVPELKSSIEARLEVTAHKDGSIASFTIG